MTIDRDWLGCAIMLVTGRQPDDAVLGQIARVLDTREEVLPWLVLRQHAFADDHEVTDRLCALAATAPRMSNHRPGVAPIDPAALPLQRAAETLLGDLIARNTAERASADTLGAALHLHNCLLGYDPAYDFRRRIVECAPIVAEEPEPGLSTLESPENPEQSNLSS